MITDFVNTCARFGKAMDPECFISLPSTQFCISIPSQKVWQLSFSFPTHFYSFYIIEVVSIDALKMRPDQSWIFRWKFLFQGNPNTAYRTSIISFGVLKSDFITFWMGDICEKWTAHRIFKEISRSLHNLRYIQKARTISPMWWLTEPLLKWWKISKLLTDKDLLWFISCEHGTLIITSLYRAP